MAANDADDYVKSGKVLESSAGDKFEVGRKIGGGQFGQVYDAKHQKKKWRNCRRSSSEDVFEKMGVSLEHLIKDRTLCISNCIKIANTLLEIFEQFQKLGLSYKDLHSGNLLFCHELFHLKLTDFGLSEMSKRNAHKDPKAWKYIYDASSVAFLLVCCRTDQKVINKPECSLADYTNEMKALKESLLESGMMFLLDFVKELISQLKGGEVSYPQLRRALSASQFTPPNKFFILTPTVPVMLA
ncbi:hypothetical protein B9Z55_027533 [Caenorhabditis nigoni]|uniref:Protein kinase domain-containing protein n=1 Tax=Caenorhabditis nigoni TaxID=1611254 RepID=A0A2G5SF50_9PELO|nr:hypothetical protein B9Z55_027533 [Caenorhabditis nigoni]